MKEDEGYKPATLFKKYKTDNSRAIASILSLNTISYTIGAAGVGQQKHKEINLPTYSPLSSDGEVR
ncbi:MAG: hypothetical protein IKI83_08730 [Prevotella sp.]|nr:hypothetical protein [Prevotella sp.]